MRTPFLIDDCLPPKGEGYAEADVDSVGTLFDQYLCPIDTTAFGRESDLHGNDQVFVLLTDQVNLLSGSCPAGDVMVGCFSGEDLLAQGQLQWSRDFLRAGTGARQPDVPGRPGGLSGAGSGP